MFFTEPSVTLGSTSYSGLSMPEPITVSGATNKSINLTKEIAEVGKATITVSITGALGADDIDVFAGSPTSFKVKTLTNPGTDPSVQLFLPDGDWMVGMSPAMPKDPMSGPPPMPNWMPPMPTKVSVSAGGTVIKETSGTSDDGTVSINLTGQSVNTVAGTVTDDGGNGIANADVYAYQPNGAFGGSNTKTANDGTFILKVPVKGVYTVGALKSGLPNGSEQAVNVQGNITGLTITMKKPAYTISGKVLNSSGSGVAYAPVWAYKPSGNGRADTMTDASGSYILYIDAGTWKIETDAPGTGWMEYGTNLTISSASLSGINIKPNSSTTYYSISGSVNIQGVAQAYMPIRAVAYDVNGNNLGKSYDAVTDSAGAYTISAPAGKYRVDIWTPEFGEVQRNDADDYANHPANVNLESGNKSGVNISIAGASLKTITIKVTNGTSAYEGFVNIEGIDANGSPTNFHRSLYISDLSQSKAISLEDGKNYLFFLNVPGLGSFIPVTGTDAADGGGGMSPTTGNIVVNGVNRDVIFSVPDTSNNSNYVTVSGAVTASGSNLKDAWVWVSNPATGFHNGTNTDSSGAYSLKLPVLSSGNYMIGADKPGYISIEPSQLNMVDDDNDGLADSNKNFVLSTYSSTISGHIYYDINSNQVKDSGENIPNGWVYAQEVATGIMSHAPVNGDGSYSLGVSNGSWQVFGAADGYLDTQYKENGVKTNITVSGSNVTGKNIALVVDANWNNRSKNKPMTPANGGVIDDTGTAGTGVKITVPANALGSSSASGSMSVSNTSSVAKTNSATPFGGKGKNIIASDNSGQPINNLNDYIDIEMVYWKSDIDAEVAANRLVDFNKLKAMQVGYFDASVNDWVTMSTARTAYYKTLASDVEWKTYSSGFSSFIDDALIGTAFTAFEDYKLVFKSSTNHLTVFGVTTPTDSTAPAAPNNLSKTSSNGSSIVLDWDNNSEADLLEYEIYRSSSTGVNKSSSQVNSSQVTASTFTDSTVSAFTSYFYTVTAVDDSGNESVVATELQVCSTSSVSNGSINSSCTITCDSGYNKSGNTCVAQSGGGGGGSMPTIYCSSVEFDVWQDSCIAGIQFRNVLKSSPAGCSLTSQQNLDRQKNCTSASDETIINETTEARPDGAGDAEKSAEAIVDSIKEIISEAQEIFKNNIESFVARFVGSRDVEKEQQYRNKYINKIVAGDSVSESVQNTMLNFVAYGTDTTKKLGAGERAGVVHSYKSALGKLPQSEVEWSDVVKIANGRWPSEINKDTEANAEAAFKKIYLRAPDRTNHHDDAAVVVMSYGLRPTNRNLDNEKAAIKSFRYIYKYDPVSASAWDIVRAIAYSGATR